MAGDPVARVFAMPELLDLIFQHFEDISGYRVRWNQLGLVARNWVAPAVAREWDRAWYGTLVRFSRISQDRQQRYAHQVRHLNLLELDELNGLLPSLTFPNLQTLSLGGHSIGGHASSEDFPRSQFDSWAPRLLGPQLRTLTLVSLMFAPEMVPYVQNLSPKLDSLSLKHPPTSGSVSLVGDFVRALPRLSSLNLPTLDWSSSEHFPSTMLAISNLEGLRWLSFETTNPTPVPDLRGMDLRFRSLRAFSCKSPYDGLTAIAKLMPSLTMIDLALPCRTPSDPSSPLISPLDPMRNLADLHLTIEGEVTLDAADFITLGHFRHLTRLRIGFQRTEGDNCLTVPGLTVEDFSNVFRNLPLLDELELRLTHSLGIAPLAIIGQHCRQLLVLDLADCYDLADMEAIVSNNESMPTPLFPLLYLAGAGGFFWGQATQWDEPSHKHLGKMIEVLAMHFPQLSLVEFDRLDILQERITAVLDAGGDLSRDPRLKNPSGSIW